jgi:predicted nucleic acid-binding protein
MVGPDKWVVNASPLICLGKLGHLDWLDQLTNELVIPFTVAREIENGPPEDAARRWLETAGALHVRAMDRIDSEIAAWDLGAGESAVLTWARCHPGFSAILDDRAARRCADVFDVAVCGTVGILMRAKRAELTPSLASVLDAAAKAGLYVSPAVRREALRLVGE